MTTPTGTISLSQVQNEFGGSHPIRISEYRQYTADGSNPTSMSELRGLTAVTDIDLYITSNTYNYDIEAQARAAGWDGNSPVEVNVQINSGVYVRGSSASTWAMRTGYFADHLVRDIQITNYGNIIGRGGRGGNGGSAGNYVGNNGASGGTGGTGLLVDWSDTVDMYNYGLLAGGGGGGGGGGGAVHNSKSGLTYYTGGGGGGGAANAWGGSGDPSGSTGGTTGGGSGGDSSGDYAGSGGSGGNRGANGSGGGSGNGNYNNGSGGSGGTRGYYVNGLSKTSFFATGTRAGRTVN